MNLTKTYFEQICPELLESEIKILIDNVLDLYRPENVYPQAVRVVAKSLFPDIIKDEKVVHIDGRDKMKKAIEHLRIAYAELDNIPQSKLTDGTGMTMLDINSSIHYLREELGKIESKEAF
jgi:hypothetical protein